MQGAVSGFLLHECGRGVGLGPCGSVRLSVRVPCEQLSSLFYVENFKRPQGAWGRGSEQISNCLEMC